MTRGGGIILENRDHEERKLRLSLLISISGLLGLIYVLYQVIRLRKEVKQTTLTGPVQWAIAGIHLWILAWILRTPELGISLGILDQIWYSVPVFMLCPFVAVLGARRPGSQVWGWFIILPMCLVLEISAIRLWGNQVIPVSFQLDTPTIVGFCIVMVMGLGNYFGTKRTGSVFLFGLILLLLVAPYSESVPGIFPQKETARIWSTFLLIFLTFFNSRQKEAESLPLPFRKVWLDFLDSYGIVWGKRLMDQMNRTGHDQNWTVHLELEGFIENSDSQPI